MLKVPITGFRDLVAVLLHVRFGQNRQCDHQHDPLERLLLHSSKVTAISVTALAATLVLVRYSLRAHDSGDTGSNSLPSILSEASVIVPQWQKATRFEYHGSSLMHLSLFRWIYAGMQTMSLIIVEVPNTCLLLPFPSDLSALKQHYLLNINNWVIKNSIKKLSAHNRV